MLLFLYNHVYWQKKSRVLRNPYAGSLRYLLFVSVREGRPDCREDLKDIALSIPRHRFVSCELKMSTLKFQQPFWLRARQFIQNSPKSWVQPLFVFIYVKLQEKNPLITYYTNLKTTIPSSIKACLKMFLANILPEIFDFHFSNFTECFWQFSFLLVLQNKIKEIKWRIPFKTVKSIHYIV